MKVLYIVLVVMYGVSNLYGVYIDKTDYSYTNITRKHTVVTNRDVPEIITPTIEQERKKVVPKVVKKVEPIVIKEPAPVVQKVVKQVILDHDNDGVLDKDDKCPNTVEGVCVDKTGCVSKVRRTIHFSSDSYEVDDAGKSTINDIYYIADECFGYKIVLKGYTDATASNEYNKKLSYQRANSIKKIFVKLGIKPDRITMKWYGEENPKYPNNTKDGRYKNRRVEILFY